MVGQSLRAASVPMFGAWDERDPKSGEGFTVIFNKVKEEKQIAASTFPPVPAQPINQPNNQETNTKSKVCLFYTSKLKIWNWSPNI